MSNAETSYQARLGFPDMLERGRTQTIALDTFLDGAVSAPTSGTVSVFDSSNTAIVDGEAVTVASSRATFSLLSTVIPDTLSVSIGYRIEWVLLMADGVVHTFRRDAFLVNKVLQIPITNQDLLDEYSDLGSLVATATTFLQTKIDAAWKAHIGRLVSDGILPQRIISPWSLRQTMIDLSLSKVFADMYATTGGTDGKYLALSGKHLEQFTDAFADLNFSYDNSGDGHDSNPSKRDAGAASVWLSAAPTTIRQVR